MEWVNQPEEPVVGPDLWNDWECPHLRHDFPPLLAWDDSVVCSHKEFQAARRWLDGWRQDLTGIDQVREEWLSYRDAMSEAERCFTEQQRTELPGLPYVFEAIKEEISYYLEALGKTKTAANQMLLEFEALLASAVIEDSQQA